MGTPIPNSLAIWGWGVPKTRGPILLLYRYICASINLTLLTVPTQVQRRGCAYFSVYRKYALISKYALKSQMRLKTRVYGIPLPKCSLYAGRQVSFMTLPALPLCEVKLDIPTLTLSV